MSPHALCAALVFVGWAGLCFAQARHHRDAFAGVGSVARRGAFGVAGGLALALAFAGLVAHDGWEFGPVLWTALLCVCAPAWVLALAADARRARWLVLIAPSCAVAIGIV